MTQKFVPSTPLERFIHAGDFDGTIDYLRHLEPTKRSGFASSIVRMIGFMNEVHWQSPKNFDQPWGGHCTREQVRAAKGALVLCGTAAQVATAWADEDDLVALAREFGPPCLPELGNAFLRRSPATIRIVQRLIAEE